MKKVILFFICSFIFVFANAQLNYKHNSLRIGDVIIKQQVQFKDPGIAGTNQVWNFSNIHLINDEYEIIYDRAPLIGDSIYIMGYDKFSKQETEKADLIIGTEHNTMYYFYQTLNSLILLGHENTAVKQENLPGIVNLKFPLNYGAPPITTKYKTKGLYSNSIDIQSEGIVSISIDAFGKLILPSGDTINPVIRVKTEQTINDISSDNEYTINDKGRLFESYRWYSKGYRYPIFETIESIDLNTDSILFSTAFYFPLQEHHYLDTDTDNQILLDDLWKHTEKEQNSFQKTDLFEDKKLEHNYILYPNPVENTLNVEYTLKKTSLVNIIMTTMDGKIVKNIKNQRQIGKHHEKLDCTNLMQGIYLVKIVADELIINEKIIKK